MATDGFHKDFPDTELARAAYEYMTGISRASLANHCLRSYLFARSVAEHKGMRAGKDYDDELVFLGCALHDLGTTEEGDNGQRFEVDGADLAVAFLTGRGLAEDRAEIVWDAVALHTSPGIAERKAPEVALAFFGIAADLFGLNAQMVPGEHGTEFHASYPRLNLGQDLADIVVAQAIEKPQKAPPFTFPAGLLRDREADRVPGYHQLLASNPLAR